MSENVAAEELSKMANDVDARREARRRKILENGRNRLAKLNGHVSDEINDHIDYSTEQKIFPDPEIETEELFGPKFSIPLINTPLKNNGFDVSQNTNELDFDLLSQMFAQKQQPTQFSSGGEQFNYSARQQQQASADSKLVRVLRTKVHLILISVLTYILFAIENDMLTSYSVFLPLLLWELTEVFILKPVDNQNDFVLSIIFLFTGISAKVSTVLQKILGTLNKIFKDVGVFVFFFVICHLIAMYFTKIE